MIITLDFETHAIEQNTSVQAPEPVGLAIKRGRMKSKYLAFGHPTENNCEYQDVYEELWQVWESDHPLLFHNAKFDIAVALQHFDLPMPDPLRILDTMYLLFLENPYSNNLSLKPNAERVLDLPPDEQDELYDWIMNNTECRARSKAGAYIAYTPGGLCGKYARGDVDRTKGIYDKLMPMVKDRLMEEPFQREQKLMPITYYSERKGVRVDIEKLDADLPMYESALTKVEGRLCKKMKVKDLDFNKNEEIADALEAAGLVHPDDWVRTPTGRRSTSKENFPLAIKNKPLLNLLRYRSALGGCLATFMRPWHALAAADGRIHPVWNQVRTHDQDVKSSKGTKTGRLSGSKPNLMNVPNEYDIAIPKGLPTPPYMRQYMLPEEGHVWCKRDFSGQEVRILAHFEDAALMKAYQQDPDLDPHQMAKDMVAQITGMDFPRKDIKFTAFGIIYGSGVTGLTRTLNRPYVEAEQIRNGYLAAFPGVKMLQKNVTKRGKRGDSIRTWGGREYFVEPPVIKKGQRMDFSYKLLNYLIQGSAADQTKECIIDWWEEKNEDDVFLATVHDEVNISAPEEHWQHSMTTLAIAMNQDLFDVPMRSEGFIGPNWFDMEECE